MLRHFLKLAFVAVLAISAGTALADDPSALAQSTCDKALAYLKSQQKPDNSWQTDTDPLGFTSLALRAFMADQNHDADEPFLDKGFDKLLSNQLEDGGIYKDVLAGYNTAVAISALAAAKEAEYQAPIKKAVEYLKSLQWSDKIVGVSSDITVTNDKDPRYGGWGYGKRGRPDLSNTQMALDALHDAGLKSDDPAYQAALKFVTRCQNLSETNDQTWSSDDGGFIYTPIDGGMSPAGDLMLGNRRLLRSYGSMTYAGLKSMIYAGLTHDDPRVKAAWGWISKNFTVDENPGMSAVGPEKSQDGFFYYCYTMSHALSAYGQPVITDAAGKPHDWRIALVEKLASIQKPDGSFIGTSNWMENSPVLSTSYTVITLEEAKNDLKLHPPQ
ncbi:MAG: prenyltransferase/squalene oxidase repeat-containing protein [Tepidisphaeraceae bacterium]|jgi:squalene-hopene/tetraprenyl-beta-curcumene cyclase